jgi:transposase
MQENSGKPRKLVRRFGAMTADLRALANWLAEQQVTHVAMESTGVYWKPVWNILEGQFTLILANAQHVKNVPGRKTDTKDSEWLAELLQYGLLHSSFVPPQLIRDLRDLTRARASLAQESSRIASRIQKVLEDANIKLASGLCCEIFRWSVR